MIKSRRMRWAGYLVCMGNIRNIFKISVGKPEDTEHAGDIQVGFGGEENIKIGFEEIRVEDVD
jgi:hypothetical protein